MTHEVNFTGDRISTVFTISTFDFLNN